MAVKQTKKRMSVTLDAALLKEINALKKKDYYNASYSELLRDLVEVGVNQMNKKTSKKGDK